MQNYQGGEKDKKREFIFIWKTLSLKIICLSAFNMILRILNKINKKFTLTMKNYKNMINFPPLKCNCGSTNLIRWGTYNRGVIFINEKGKVQSSTLTIQRVCCKDCGKTHAIIPVGLIPYKQITDELISEIFNSLLSLKIEKVSNLYLISESTIKKYIHHLRTIHLPKVATLMKCHSYTHTLKKFFKNISNKFEYIKRYFLCFMQIRLGVLIPCSS